MNKLEWSKKLSVGVDEIDEQHKKLIILVNKVYLIENPNDNRNEFECVLNELVEFTRIHFSTEEKYFEKFNYEGKDEHIQEHLKLIESVLKFKDKFDEGSCEYEKFLIFLNEWVVKHLVEMDQKYVKCFKENGLS